MNATANMDVADGGEKKKRVIKNPQPKLNADRLMGPRGVHTIEELFKVSGKYKRIHFMFSSNYYFECMGIFF